MYTKAARLPGPRHRLTTPPVHGFTLVEVMVVVAVIAILATLAAPSFNDAILSNKLTGYANSFVSSAQLARSEAIKRGRTVKLCASADGTACAASGGWEQGWIVQFVDVDGVTKVAQRQQALTSDYRFTGTGNVTSLDFLSVGVGSTAATLTLCRATPTAGSQERVVTVSTTGNASTKKTTAASCS